MASIVNHCNLSFQKIWNDNSLGMDHLIEIALDVWTEHGYMHQEFYTTVSVLNDLGQRVSDHSLAPYSIWTFVFEESGYHDSVIFELLSADHRGIVPISVDVRVLDNPNEDARCQIRIEAESGMLERFGRSIQRVASGDVGSLCRLNPELPSRPIFTAPA